MNEFELTEMFGETRAGFVIAGHFHKPDTYMTHRPEGMDDWLITFTLEGCGLFRTPEGEQRCGAGDVALLRSGVPHWYGTCPGERWHFLWAHVPAVLIDAGLLPDGEVTVVPIETGFVRRRIYRAFHRVLADSRERGDGWQDLCLSALKEVLILTVRRRRGMDPRIEETLHLLSQHMREPFRVDAIARTVGLSPSRLSHLFKQETGSSIVDTLNRMRIRQAALLIEHSGRSASEAAYDVGFQNYNHFANQFKKVYGVSPRALRRPASPALSESDVHSGD